MDCTVVSELTVKGRRDVVNSLPANSLPLTLNQSSLWRAADISQSARLAVHGRIHVVQTAQRSVDWWADCIFDSAPSTPKRQSRHVDEQCAEILRSQWQRIMAHVMADRLTPSCRRVSGALQLCSHRSTNGRLNLTASSLYLGSRSNQSTRSAVMKMQSVELSHLPHSAHLLFGSSPHFSTLLHLCLLGCLSAVSLSTTVDLRL